VSTRAALIKPAAEAAEAANWVGPGGGLRAMLSFGIAAQRTPAGAWLRTVVVDSSQHAGASTGRYGWASAEVESAAADACLHA
jgi:hypothetical protein